MLVLLDTCVRVVVAVMYAFVLLFVIMSVLLNTTFIIIIIVIALLLVVVVVVVFEALAIIFLKCSMFNSSLNIIFDTCQIRCLDSWLIIT